MADSLGQMAGMNVRTRPDMGLRNYIMDMDGRGHLEKSSVQIHLESVFENSFPPSALRNPP